MTVRCLDGSLLLKPHPQDRTRGGLVLPGGVQIHPVGRLTVLAAGPGFFTPGGEWFKMDLKPGDDVLLQPGAAVAPFQYEGEQCVFADRIAVLAIVEGEEDAPTQGLIEMEGN